MKYIMLEQTIGTVTRKIPIIFPNFLIHEDIGLAILNELTSKNTNTRIVNAGEAMISCTFTYGKSTTLKLEADENDSYVIDNYDYLHGII